VAVIWDPRKLKSNVEKHGIRFPDAVAVLEDPRALTVGDHDSDLEGEERFVTLGCDAKGRVLVVVYAWRADDIRLISARDAEPHEREDYENQ